MHCCRLPFSGSVMTKDWVHGVGHSPVCQILLQIVVRPVITSSPPAWTSSTGCCGLQLTSLSSVICSAASTSLRKMGWSSSVSVWVQFSTDGSPLALQLYSSEQYSVHRSSLSPVGMPSYCCSSSDFLQSRYTVLLSSLLSPFSCTS